MGTESNSPVFLVFVFCLGISLGVLYFGALWITVKKTAVSSSPRLLLYGSMILRLSLCLASFYFLLIQGWQLLVVAMTGFLLVRYCCLYMVSNPRASKTSCSRSRYEHNS